MQCMFLIVDWSYLANAHVHVQVDGLEVQALIPFFDFANHDPSSSCWHDVNHNTGCFELLAKHHAYKAGQEVLVSYGAKNSR